MTLWLNIEQPKIARERNKRLSRSTEKLIGALKVCDDEGITIENA